MDIGSLIGIIAGAIFMCFGILSAGEGFKGFLMFIDLPSIILVIGGTAATMLILSPLEQCLNGIKIITKVFLIKKNSIKEIIAQMVQFATRARREGILALEEEADKSTDTFLKQGIQLAVDGTSPEAIKEILENEISALEGRHSDGQGLLKAGGTYAPAFGMIGTLIGLILMLATLDKPDGLGPKMGVALITTFYGAVIANFICLPMADKLKTRSKEEILLKEVIIEGILSIQSGDNPRLVEQKLNAFISPRLRISNGLKDKKEG